MQVACQIRFPKFLLTSLILTGVLLILSAFGDIAANEPDPKFLQMHCYGALGHRIGASDL